MIFIPAEAPEGFLQSNSQPTKCLQLFVRRVFITDDLDNILPKWLSFIKVVIDSDDLPLNVNRETLQSHASLKIIRNRITTKALDLLLGLAEKEPEAYTKFYEKYNLALLYGFADAKSKHQDKLMKLLRFETSSASMVSFEKYVENMKKGQPQIYYATGNYFDQIKALPLVEKVIKRGYEVIFLHNNYLEYVVAEKIKKFGDFNLQNVGKDGLLFGDECKDIKEKS